ncbi:hemerythrin domain-containing protein [Nocardioides sp. MAHUQ-72]|uniref:hemerythrin domain-containing protein n=1 Tax=unclassified Nocardioides TaxID=2615069 RepID=UPI003615B9CD
MTATPQQATWPRQLRLPGQADAPEGPVDLSMMYLMHHAFRRDLAAFARAVPRTPITEPATWRALLRRWEVFSEALHHHHRGEDTWLWPALVAKADADERQVLTAMAAEHDEIDPLLTGCLAGLRMLAGGHASPDDRAALAVRLCAARESLGRHLAHEERDAMRILQRHLTPEEFEAVDARFVEDLEPRRLLALVPWALHEVPTDVRRDLRRRARPAQRVVWRLTRRRFERLDRRAFRYAG